jgi:hypothetical protein
MSEMQLAQETSRPRALNVLLQASSLLLHAGSEDMLLSQILDLARDLLVADAYGVWRESGEGLVWWRIAQQGLSDTYPKTLELHGKHLPQDVWFMEDIQNDERAVGRRRDDQWRDYLLLEEAAGVQPQ